MYIWSSQPYVYAVHIYGLYICIYGLANPMCMPYIYMVCIYMYIWSSQPYVYAVHIYGLYICINGLANPTYMPYIYMV